MTGVRAWTGRIGTFFTAMLLAACGGGGGGGGGGAPLPPPGPPAPVVFEKNRDSSGVPAPILIETGGAAFDGKRVDSPAIVVDPARPDRFLLYYEAADQNNANTIGVATSSSRTFGQTAIRGQVLGLGASGTGLDAAGLEDPTVVLDTRPGMPRYRMWYEGRSGPFGEFARIIASSSNDGVTWNAFQPTVGLEPGTAVSFARVRVEDPVVVRDGDTFKMWFEAVDSVAPNGSDGPGRIGYAESTDGIAWTVMDAQGRTGAAAGPVFGPGGPADFDSVSVRAPTVVIDDEAFGSERFILFYEGATTFGEGDSRIGIAVSENGLDWRRFGTAAIGPSSEVGAFDDQALEHPSAFVDTSIAPTATGRFVVYYGGDSTKGTPTRIGLARGRVSGP